MASHLLGVSGRKRSGKDTFAARLVSHHGFTRVAFADPLKAVARDLDPIIGVHQSEALNLSDVLAYDESNWEYAKEVPEVRRILQVLGVAVREHVDPEAWVDAAMRQADEIPGPVVITDCRFPNEAHAVRRFWRFHGPVGAQTETRGKLVRINRPGLPDTDLHISETALDDVDPDYWINNNGTVADLNERADKVARYVLAS